MIINYNVAPDRPDGPALAHQHGRTLKSPVTLELVPGYNRFTFGPNLTRVSMAPGHRHRRDALAIAALLIRERLEEQGALTHRLQGNPRMARNGKITVVLSTRTGRRLSKITVTPAEILAHLQEWATA
ncbi:hypothetical protein [Nocardia sp. GP40]|uniref:hypothetical protein n=1 Tax=Nocardia sp. GP40 TaxID=3156268 RepID=UPI003D225FA3